MVTLPCHIDCVFGSSASFVAQAGGCEKSILAQMSLIHTCADFLTPGTSSFTHCLCGGNTKRQANGEIRGEPVLNK
jgi:hypothetical protein